LSMYEHTEEIWCWSKIKPVRYSTEIEFGCDGCFGEMSVKVADKIHVLVGMCISEDGKIRVQVSTDEAEKKVFDWTYEGEEAS
jgi:hypothetical protein